MSDTIQKNSRQLQAESTKQKLLDVSLSLIKEQGFDNVKIEDICKMAEVSTGAFYHHIKSKAGIVIEAYSQCDEYFKNTVTPALYHRTDANSILEYIDYQMKYAEDFGVDITTQIYKAQLTEGTEFFLSDDRHLSKGLVELIQRLQELSVVSKGKNSKIIATEILTISRGILYNWCQNKGSYDLTAFAHDIVSNYLKNYIL